MSLLTRKKNRRLLLVALGLAVLAAACIDAAIDQAAEDRAGGATDSLSFAETREFWTAPTLLAKELGLFEKQDLSVDVVKYDTGLQAKNAVVNRATDLGIVADTPVAVSGFLNEDIRLLATYFESDSIVRLVGRTDGEPIDPSFVKGRRVGYVRGTISEIYLERMIAKYGERYGFDRDSIRTATFEPNEMPTALARGDIDAFVGWEPLGIYAKRLMGDDVDSWSDPELYTVSLHLVTRPDVLERKQRALAKFLRALQEAERVIRERPEEARQLVEQAAKLEPGELEPYWGTQRKKLSFVLKLQPDEIVERLTLEARWLIDSGNAPGRATAMPAYERLIDGTVYATLPRPS